MLDILYQDDYIALVNKPSGLLALPGKAEVDSVTHHFKKQNPQCIDQPAVHRLDMDTSGLMLLALTKESHKSLSKQFQERKTFKRYIALLDGIIQPDSGKIELPFRLDIDNRPHQIYDPIYGKIGITEWKKISIQNKRTKVQFTPLTGRTHQLRLHASHEKGLGVPIVGDTLYGGHPRHGELLLHSTELRFIHPQTNKEMSFICEPKF